MNRGDIYLVDLDPSQDHEQQGRRPVLVISPSSFNSTTGVPVVLPITNGGAFAERIGFAVEITGKKTTYHFRMTPVPGGALLRAL